MTIQGVGRKRHDPYEVGVCVRLPTALLAAVDAFAEDDLCKRSVAMRDLLEAGLAAKGRPVTPSDAEPRR